MFKKYKWNFVLVVLLVSVIGFIIFDVIFYHSIKKYLFEQAFHEMRMKTSLAVKLMEQKSLTQNISELTFQIRNIVNARVTIIDSTGRVLSDSDVASDRIPFLDNHSNRPEIREAIAKGEGQSYRKSDTIEQKLFYTALPLRYQNKIIGFLRLAYHAQHFEESMSNIVTLLIAANIIGLGTLFLIALLSGSLVTFPILRIVSTAQKISTGDLDLSFPVRRKDEIGTLALILNQLTERLKTQIEQISNERTKLQNILNQLDAGVIVVDQNKSILHANPKMFQILKREPYEIEHKNVIEVLRAEPILTAIDRSLHQGNKETGEVVYYNGQNKIFLSYVITPFFIAEEKITGALIQLHDVTELRQLEAIRRDFVANASHELKTPLTAIVGYTETLLEGAAEEPASRVKFIRRIREQAQRLEFLVADLLKLSEIEHDVPLALKQVKLIPLAREIIADFKEQSDQKNIKILLESFEQNIIVKADEELLRTVFNNLIDNAIKYTPQSGTITIRFAEVPNHRVKIEVADTGVGIDPKYHERIFQRFYRVDKTRSRALGGTGLGLAIVKHIIERHGSKIYVESELGKGSCFWFELARA
ncbi:MAG: ATP-binding protein [candidate division KSB1 bacterium]|nr:ATP-binding protein [candidate division KSB1 bacterium]